MSGDANQDADPIPAIAESDATGEVAELFAEIRETLDLPVVNLIWRHFATTDGGLRWAWETLAPLYVSGAAERAASHLTASLALPRLATVPASVLRGAGVDDADRATVLAIMDSYNRGNALNICALNSLLVAAAGEPRGPGTAAALPVPAVPVPPVPRIADLSPEVRDLVWTLNGLGQVPDDNVLATAYRHLAAWPGLLALIWGLLAPMHHDGRLAALIDASGRAAREEGARLVHLQARTADCPAATQVRTAAAHFVAHVIGRMMPVMLMLRQAMPER